MNESAAQRCPVCLRPLRAGTTSEDYGERNTINCACCGRYTFTGSAEGMLANRELAPIQRAALMHRVRMSSEREGFVLDSKTLRLWLEGPVVPTPYQQIENIIGWLAGHLKAAGERVDLVFDEYQAIIGAADADGFGWVLQQAAEQHWLDGSEANSTNAPASLLYATLTLDGWRFADEIRKAKGPSQIAFMAMKFGDAETDALYKDILAPAVAATGFTLRRLDEGQPAGLIDDQMPVAIRQARFLLVDLTHGNKAAYWEAGFGEGLDKPVIYLCREDVFNNAEAEKRPHFDTSHLVTVVWNPARVGEAGTRLKACIRATLPAEAVMADSASDT